MRVVVLDELHVAYPPQVEVDAAVLDAVAVVPVPAAPHTNFEFFFSKRSKNNVGKHYHRPDVHVVLLCRLDGHGDVPLVHRPDDEERVEEVALPDLHRAVLGVPAAAVRVDGAVEAVGVEGVDHRVGHSGGALNAKNIVIYFEFSCMTVQTI